MWPQARGLRAAPARMRCCLGRARPALAAGWRRPPARARPVPPTRPHSSRVAEGWEDEQGEPSLDPDVFLDELVHRRARSAAGFDELWGDPYRDDLDANWLAQVQREGLDPEGVRVLAVLPFSPTARRGAMACASPRSNTPLATPLPPLLSPVLLPLPRPPLSGCGLRSALQGRRRWRRRWLSAARSGGGTWWRGWRCASAAPAARSGARARTASSTSGRASWRPSTRRCNRSDSHAPA